MDMSSGRGYTGLKAIQETKRRYRQYTGETTLSVPLLRAAYRVREQLNEDFKKEAEAADWPPYLYNEYRERNALKYSDFYPNVVWFFLYLMTSESLGEAAEDFIPDSLYDEYFDARVASGVTREESERHLLRQKCAELPVPFPFGYCAGWDRLVRRRIREVCVLAACAYHPLFCPYPKVRAGIGYGYHNIYCGVRQNKGSVCQAGCGGLYGGYFVYGCVARLCAEPFKRLRL